MHNKVHIAGRGLVVRQLRILASQFVSFGQERYPKSAPTTCTNRCASCRKSDLQTRYNTIKIE
jgi:hypothetical protein